MVNISDAEWKVMNVLWESSPRTITELTKILSETEGWSKHSIITFLKRLDAKGAVYYEEGERAKQYYAKIPQNEATLEETKNFLNKAFKGKIGLMINTLVKEEELTEQDLDELYEILEKERKNK